MKSVQFQWVELDLVTVTIDNKPLGTLVYDFNVDQWVMRPFTIDGSAKRVKYFDSLETTENKIRKQVNQGILK